MGYVSMDEMCVPKKKFQKRNKVPEYWVGVLF